MVVPTSSLTRDVEEFTHAIQRLASQSDTHIAQPIIFAVSVNLQQTFGCKDYCGSTALAMPESERTDWRRLASTVDITAGLQPGTAQVRRHLKTFLNMNRPDHGSSSLKEKRSGNKTAAGRGVENQNCRWKRSGNKTADNPSSQAGE